MDSIFIHTENNGEVIITGLQRGVATTSIVIPETIDGMPVTEIARQAFYGSPITDVTIGENIRVIGKQAFYMCKKLSSVTWNRKCNVIPADCFDGCSNLAQFDFSGIKKIGQHAFSRSGLQKVCLPKNIESISERAFGECKELRTVEWNCTCDVISAYCFYECSNLTQFDFLNVKKIGQHAFRESGLQKVCLPKNIESISERAFGECKELRTVEWNCTCDVISDYCFIWCSNLTQFDFSSVKKIGARAFKGSGLTSVILNKGTEVGKSCFAYCGNLEKVEWLSARSIKGDIFESCKNIKEIFISDKVKNIEVSAFTSSPNAEISFI